MQARRILSTFLLAWLSVWVAQGQSSSAAADQFVKVEGMRFVVNCQTFYVAGWNQWETMEAAAGSTQLYGASLPPNTSGPQLVRTLLDDAISHGANVVRVWAQTVSTTNAMELSPGDYNEAFLQGLDYLLDQARQRGLRLLMVLVDNWQIGGVDTIVQWAGSGLQHEDFFTNEQAKQLYKQRVETIVTRVNTINGRTYSEDPTIFAWDLINEPRCYQCGNVIGAWVSEMAAYVKSLDANHMVTIGEEGFYPSGGRGAWANPQGLGSWACDEGQDFYGDHNDPNIDFAAMHLWPDNWEDNSTGFIGDWIQQHLTDAQGLGKPLLLEEFGKDAGADMASRNAVFTQVYAALEANMQSNGAAAGALFWLYFAQGQEAPSSENGGAGGVYGIFSYDSTFSIINGFTDTARQAAGITVQGCQPPALAAASMVVAPNCTATRVRGRPGTGFEGPGCTVDINECLRGTAGCAAQGSGCINTVGGYDCVCVPGYVGDGFTCQASAAAQRALELQFTTRGPGKLACDEGSPIAYPLGAPGYSYDPTRRPANNTRSGAASVSVTAQQCMAACEMAAGCTAISYNPTLEQCYLKANASTTVCESPVSQCFKLDGSLYPCGTWQTYYKTVSGVDKNQGVESAPIDERVAPTIELILDPKHPATQVLRSAAPDPEVRLVTAFG